MEFQLGISQTQEHIESCFNEIEFAEKITSLVNSNGGILIIGINAKGKIKGVYPKDELDNIPLIIENYCSSSIVFDTDIKEVENKLLLILRISPGVKTGVLSLDKSITYYYRIVGVIKPVSKIVSKLWRFQKEQTKDFPLDVFEIELVYNFIDKSTLSQVYNLCNLPKSTIDIAISWLLYTQKIKMLLAEENVIYQHSS